jgi:hypothetical protein
MLFIISCNSKPTLNVTLTDDFTKSNSENIMQFIYAFLSACPGVQKNVTNISEFNVTLKNLTRIDTMYEWWRWTKEIEISIKLKDNHNLSKTKFPGRKLTYWLGGGDNPGVFMFAGIYAEEFAGLVNLNPEQPFLGIQDFTQIDEIGGIHNPEYSTKMTINSFYDLLEMNMDTWVWEGAREYISIADNGNPLKIKTNGIGDYNIYVYYDTSEKYITKIEYFFIDRGTKYENERQYNIICALVDIVEQTFADEDDYVIGVVREIYGLSNNEEYESLHGNIYKQESRFIDNNLDLNFKYTIFTPFSS